MSRHLRTDGRNDWSVIVTLIDPRRTSLMVNNRDEVTVFSNLSLDSALYFSRELPVWKNVKFVQLQRSTVQCRFGGPATRGCYQIGACGCLPTHPDDVRPLWFLGRWWARKP